MMALKRSPGSVDALVVRANILKRKGAAAAEEKKKKSSRKTLTEEDKAEEEFDKMERKFLIKLGLVEPNEDELEEGA